MEKKTFAERLKEARNEKGWSQAELCRRTGANYNTYIQWERGVTEVSEYFQYLVIEDIERGGSKWLKK